jgi:hypothetical protein
MASAGVKNFSSSLGMPMISIRIYPSNVPICSKSQFAHRRINEFAMDNYILMPYGVKRRSNQKFAILEKHARAILANHTIGIAMAQEHKMGLDFKLLKWG